MMKTNALEILIVVVVLIVLAFMFGCKDEVEAIEANFEVLDINWAPNYLIDLKLYGGDLKLYGGDLPEYVTFSVGEDNEIVCDGTREKWLRVLYESMSGKEPTEDVTLRFEEPNESRYYHPLDPCAYTCPKCYEGASGNLCPEHYEPDEPEIKEDD